MEPVQYLRAIRRRWWVIPIATLLGGAAAFVTSETVRAFDTSSLGTSYSATTTLWDQSQIVGEGTTVIQMAALPQALEFRRVAEIAAKSLGREDIDELQASVSSFADETTGFFEITVVGDTPREAERISSAFGDALPAYLAELKTERLDERQDLLERQLRAVQTETGSEATEQALRDALALIALERVQPISLVRISEPVAVEVETGALQPPRSRLSRVLLGAAIGFLAGIALALVLERFDTRIRTRRRAEECFGLPVLGEIPEIGRKERDEISTAVAPTGKPADAFRLLAVSIGGAWGTSGGPNGNGDREGFPRTILITSAGPGDGKTTVAGNLAAVYGEMGKRVTLISCDLRRPTIHRAFHVTVSPGLTDLLTSANGHQPEPIPTDVTNVALVPSGSSAGSPGELLGSERMRRMLTAAAGQADLVILDCSPVLVASDVAPLLPLVDAVVLVARAGETHAELAERTGEVLRGLAAPVLGVVLNGARETTMPSGYRRSYYRTDKKGRLVSEVKGGW